MQKRAINIAVLAAAMATSAAAEVGLEVVAEWNNVPCAVKDPADHTGNNYMTALSLDGIMKFDESTGQVSRLVHHPEMNWPDRLAWGPDGELYVVSNHHHVWVDGEMGFEDPEIPSFRIRKIPGVGKSYTSEQSSH